MTEQPTHTSKKHEVTVPFGIHMPHSTELWGYILGHENAYKNFLTYGDEQKQQVY